MGGKAEREAEDGFDERKNLADVREASGDEVVVGDVERRGRRQG